MALKKTLDTFLKCSKYSKEEKEHNKEPEPEILCTPPWKRSILNTSDVVLGHVRCLSGGTAGVLHGSTAGMLLTLLFLLILRSGRGSLVWISSSGVLPSGGSSRFLLFRVSGNH